MRQIAALLGALVLAASCTSGAQVATRSTTDWPMFRGDLSRDGHPPGATLTRDQLKHYRLKWSHTLNGAVDGTPVVVNGLVYAASFGGRLDAYHLDDGARRLVERLGGDSGCLPEVAEEGPVEAVEDGEVRLVNLLPLPRSAAEHLLEEDAGLYRAEEDEEL